MALKTSCDTPGPARWIVELRFVARLEKALYAPSPNTIPLSSRVIWPSPPTGFPVRLHVPLAGSGQFCKLRPPACRPALSFYEDLTARQQGRPVVTKYAVEASREAPGSNGRIIHLRTRDWAEMKRFASTCNQHRAVGQQRRRVANALDIHLPRGTPSPARRVGQFCAACTRKMAPRHQNHPVRQQGRRVPSARGVEAARDTPGPARQIIKFRAVLTLKLRLPPAPCR